jgi:hypothetical protein
VLSLDDPIQGAAFDGALEVMTGAPVPLAVLVIIGGPSWPSAGCMRRCPTG